MKKLALILIAMMGFVFAANAQQARKEIQGDNGNTVVASITNDSQTSSIVTIYNNSTKTVEVCISIYAGSSGRSKVAEGCFSVSGASAEGYHSETVVTLSKAGACSTCTSGCEAKGITIDKATAKK